MLRAYGPYRSAATFRDRADEAQAMAEAMKDPDARRFMMDVARVYRQLAERQELMAKDAALVGAAMQAKVKSA